MLLFLEQCDPRILSAYHYWDAKRLGREMPSRADIDPTEIPNLLPNIILVDVEHDPLRLRYRLVGTDIVRKSGFDPTGERIGDAYFGTSLETVMANYRVVTETKQVCFRDTPFFEPRGWYVYGERLMMPLSDDGQNVNMVLIYALWNDARSVEGDSSTP